MARLGLNNPADEIIFIRRVLSVLQRCLLSETPVEVSEKIHDVFRELFGKIDPYEEVKEMSNKKALELYPHLKKVLLSSEDRLLTGIQISIVGNIIDYGAKNSLDIQSQIDSLFAGNLDFRQSSYFHYENFKRDLSEAKNILYVLDNAGEIVFDLLFIEHCLKDKRVSAVVRSRPVLNDATMKDVRTCRLDKVMKVFPSGSCAPGTMLKQCTDEFRKHYAKADLIISKGQGNFESLEDKSKNIYYLLKVKCPLIAKSIGAELGSQVLMSNQFKESHHESLCSSNNG